MLRTVAGMDSLRLRAGRPVGVVLSLLAVSLLLTGCVAPPLAGPGDAVPSVEPTGPVADDEWLGPETGDVGDVKDAASVSMAGQQFEFELSFCSVTEEDVLVQGPGRDVDSGEVAFFGVDLVRVDGWLTGELRIELGVDSEFASGDEAFMGLVGEDHEHVFSPRGDGFTLDVQLRATSSSTPLGPASVTVSCG